MDYDEVKAAIAERDGVGSVPMWRLRDAEGAGRLSKGINERISKALERRGLGHVPYKAEDLPTLQDEEIRVFDRTSAIGIVIEAAHNPGRDRDEELRERVDQRSSEMIEQIRAIVCENG